MEGKVMKATKGKFFLFAVQTKGKDWQVVHTNNGLPSPTYTAEQLRERGWKVKVRKVKG